jgi:hypothetical protein
MTVQDAHLQVPSVVTEPNNNSPKRWLHLLLFGLTFVTTTQVGLWMSESFYFESLYRDGASLQQGIYGIDAYARAISPVVIILGGFSYSVSILAILLAHELGHYLTAKKYDIDTSLPYFIPMISAFGTMGAFIKMNMTQAIPVRRFLRIAAYGPIAGFIVTIPVLIIGLKLSVSAPIIGELEGGVALGDSLLLLALERMMFPVIPDGFDIWLHPMAFAGWAGLFVTALNLLPVGQLDGGHIGYCMWGKHHNRIVPFLFAALLLLMLTVFSGWLAICILVLLFGVRHPHTCYDHPLHPKERWLGWVSFAIFVVSFTPIPFGGMPTLMELLGL